MQKINQYSFDQHRHLFAAWCTSTSSSSSPRCRFKVKIGLEILNKSNVNGSAIEKEFALFNNQDCFDEWHKCKCYKLISVAESLIKREFTYGVAAKMLNCYIKAYFISSNLMEKYPFIHPPIDRVLLGELSKVNFGGKGKKFSKFKEVGWSNFEDKQYFEVIALIRESLLGTPMWKIEAYWSGHQS